MKKPKTFSIYCEVYGVNLLVISDYSYRAMIALLKRRYDIDFEQYYRISETPVGGCVLDFDKPPFHVLFLGDKLTSDGKAQREHIIPKIAHEVFHHVLRVCDNSNIPTSPGRDGEIHDEAAAYLMEFYMREILKKLSK